MKKLFKFSFLIILAAVCVFLTAACGNKSSNALANTTEVARYFNKEKIRLGWNLGNRLDTINWSDPAKTIEGSWSANTSASMDAQKLINGVKAQGVDLIRIPVTWTGFTGDAPDYTISPARLSRVKEVVDISHDAGLKVIINLHHDGVSNGGSEWGWLKTGFNASDPTRGSNAVGTISDEYKIEMYARFKKVWEQIADYFKDYDQWLIFQSMNEVHNGNWDNFPAMQYTIMNELNQIFSDTVRASGGKNAARFLMYPGLAAKPSAILNNRFKLPEDSAGHGYQIVTFHYYDPFPFVHDASSDSSWTGTNAEKNSVDYMFKQFMLNFTSQGIPVIIGEMGPRFRGNTTDETREGYRLAYILHVYKSARDSGLVPVYWDDGGNFIMMDRNSGQPVNEHAADSFAAMRKAVGKK